jgi:glycosyltransferase involved in cell wall biosynthesis
MIINKKKYIYTNDKVEDKLIITTFIKKFLIILLLLIIYYRFIDTKNKYTKNVNITQIKYNNNIEYSFSNYILICEKKIRLKLEKIYNQFPFISVCIPTYNTEKFIERSVLSVINQSFQDFEIIIVNDSSNDNTKNIIQKIQLEDKRIKIINHNTNLGSYHSRVEAVLNSKSKYILFLDSDDMLLNGNLFKEFHNYNKNKYYDIIEFLVCKKNEKKKEIYYPKSQRFNHNHRYRTKIIYQPELSSIIFYKPRTKTVTFIICRTIWNKIYKREIQLKTIKYIGENYYNNRNLIMAEDTMINVINFCFANNYTNINLAGYLYIHKTKSISHGYKGIQHRIRQNISFLLYFNLLYKYIKDFNKDLNFLFYEMSPFKQRLLEFKTLKIYNYMNNLETLLINIKNEKTISKQFKDLIDSIYNKIFIYLK